MKNKIIFIILATILLAGCNMAGNVVKEKQEISVRLPVPVMGAHFTQYFATVDQGYYDDENLDVTFNFGDPQNNPIKMIAAGVDDIGLIG
ncbi:MAG: ABC transporter substrate-binding protein, partial [Candidatus Woesearchaeota archaeon]